MLIDKNEIAAKILGRPLPIDRTGELILSLLARQPPTNRLSIQGLT